MKKLFVLLLLIAGTEATNAQRFLTDMMDTTTTIGKGLYPLYGKHDRLRFGGYMQPQFQWAQEKGTKTFDGGDFAPNSDNRFMLRRGRIRIDYAHYNENNQPLALFAFQFDGTERGVAIRDFWGRFYENKLQMLALTAGMFARPMGFEVNLSSSDRESPERGRMSQTLMKTERDLGMMVTFENRKKDNPIKWMKFDLGIFNGQGLAGPGEYDSHKDLIGRFSFKPTKIKKLGWIVSASASGYYGGIVSQSPWVYKTTGEDATAMVKGDSVQGNVGYVSPRQYIGADAQLKIPNKKGYTEFRAEYIMGTQTGTATTSETPGTYPVSSTPAIPQPLYARRFDGAYFYYLQHLGLDWLQLVVKYDWYDPNKKVKAQDVTATRGFNTADIRYNTLTTGFMFYLNAHVKTFVFYDWVKNESTGITGYTSDVKDNIVTVRLQYRF
jgi:phosphate-selective porin